MLRRGDHLRDDLWDGGEARIWGISSFLSCSSVKISPVASLAEVSPLSRLPGRWYSCHGASICFHYSVPWWWLAAHTFGPDWHKPRSFPARALWSPLSTQNCLFSLDQWNNPNLSTTWQNILWARLGPMEMFIQSQSVVDINSVGISKFCFRQRDTFPQPRSAMNMSWMISTLLVSMMAADHASAHCWSRSDWGLVSGCHSRTRLCLGQAGEPRAQVTRPTTFYCHCQL